MNTASLASLALVLLSLLPAFGQEAKAPEQSLPDLGAPAESAPPASAAADIAPAPETLPAMPGMSAADMRHMGDAATDGSAHAMRSMESRQMNMGPHMKMTTLRDLRPGDQEKADRVLEAARKAMEKYTDYNAALADGYKIFLPNLPQKQYHFTNYRYGFEAAFTFNPEHPTSLLYEKHDEGYKLIGVMYTAPRNATWNELDQRIPLSIAEWHAHVNLCLPPADRRKEAWGPSPRFGLAGSITTRTDCEAAGGKFLPQIFGWMVHVYPTEQRPEDIWSVARQMHDHTD